MNLDTHDVRFNYPQAKRVLSLVNEYTDFSKMTVGDVLDLRTITAQLERIIKEEENADR